MKIRVAIVEDIKETREGLNVMIEFSSDFFCAGAFENAESLVKIFKHLEVDVVLMDINLPGQSGIECIEKLKEQRPHVQFLVVTNFEDTDKIFAALSACATGYILKNISQVKLHEAIKDIYKGGSPMSMEIARKIVDSFTGRNKNKELFNSLNSREKEVLELLDKGYHYKEIADKLSLKLDTIRTYVRYIYEKLHVHSRIDTLNKVYPKNFVQK